MPKEAEVENAMRRYLSNHGFTVKERPTAHGVDIEASRGEKVHFIEVEGNSKRNGSPLDPSQKYTHLLRAVGQLCLRLNDAPDAILWLVLPEDEYYMRKVAELRNGFQRLGVTVYFVRTDGKVE